MSAQPGCCRLPLINPAIGTNDVDPVAPGASFGIAADDQYVGDKHAFGRELVASDPQAYSTVMRAADLHCRSR